MWQNDGRIVDDVDFPTQLGLTRFPSQEAMQWFVDLQTVHGVVPDRVAEASQDSESRFVAGTTAMYLNSRRSTPTYREIDSFTWDVAPLPRGKQEAGVLHSDGYCMAATTENKDAAWRFIEFANSAEGQTIIAQSGRTVRQYCRRRIEAFSIPINYPVVLVSGSIPSTHCGLYP